MKNKKIIGSLIVVAFVLMFLGSIGNSRSLNLNNSPKISQQTTKYLVWREYVFYGLEMNQGDNLTWSFETYEEEFKVEVKFFEKVLSFNKTNDSGVWFAPRTDIFWLVFRNWDIPLLRSGFINISLEVRGEPIPDTTEPIWIFPPINQVIEYGKPFSYDINAYDLSNISRYWINNTIYFNIDENGVITNPTMLDVGIYWLEVRAYDPYENYCNAIFKVDVQAIDIPEPEFKPEPDSLLRVIMIFIIPIVIGLYCLVIGISIYYIKKRG